jgi:hypothetical protein
MVRSMAAPKSVLDPVIRKVFDPSEEYQAFGANGNSAVDLPDFVFATANDDHDPQVVFPRIRWGGQFVYVDESLKKVQETARQFSDYGFSLEQDSVAVSDGWRLWPLFRRKVHFFAARKTQHVPKGGLTDRFTFEVELSEEKEKHNGQYVVTKRIPSVEWVVNRLRKRNPELAEDELERRAQGLIRNIFPIFLTREVAMMRRLNEHLPEQMRKRVPHTIRFEQDDRGLIKLLQVNWLRNGGKPLSQVDFAIQASEILHAIHAKAGVAHLDLRLDNMVITPDGVGVIDFGNSVHDDEDINSSPTLQKVFHELMRSCQVQRAMHKAIQTGHVTAPYFVDALFKPHKAVDLFFLVLQFTSPHDNPDLKDFILHTPNSKEDYEISKMTRRLFAPEDLEPGKTYEAAHVANALRTIKRRLG